MIKENSQQARSDIRRGGQERLTTITQLTQLSPRKFPGRHGVLLLQALGVDDMEGSLVFRANQAHKCKLCGLALGSALGRRSATAGVNVLLLSELEEFGVTRLAGHYCEQGTQVFIHIPIIKAFAQLLSSSTGGQIKARGRAETYPSRARRAKDAPSAVGGSSFNRNNRGDLYRSDASHQW